MLGINSGLNAGEIMLPEFGLNAVARLFSRCRDTGKTVPCSTDTSDTLWPSSTPVVTRDKSTIVQYNCCMEMIKISRFHRKDWPRLKYAWQLPTWVKYMYLCQYCSTPLFQTSRIFRTSTTFLTRTNICIIAEKTTNDCLSCLIYENFALSLSVFQRFDSAFFKRCYF